MTPHQYKLLLVDGNPTELQRLSGAFRDEHFAVLVARNPAVALLAASEERPDVIVIGDLVEGSPEALLRQFKGSPDLSQVPVVAYAAGMEEERRLRLLERGVADCMDRRVGIQEVVLRLQILARGHRHIQMLMETNGKLTEVSRRLGKEKQELRRHLARDPATGLWAEEFMAEEVKRFMSNCHRYDHCLSAILLAFADEDESNYRPTEGFMAASLHALSDVCRVTDRFGHWEDDRLLLLLPETPLEHARLVAGRARDAVADVLNLPGKTGRGLCVGVAHFHPEEHDPEADIIARTLDALEGAMLEAPGTIYVAEEPSEEPV